MRRVEMRADRCEVCAVDGECSRCTELPTLPPAEPFHDGSTPDPSAWGPVTPHEPHREDDQP